MRALIKRWEKVPLRWKGVVLAIVPFLVLLLSASMALWGNHERERTETALARHIALSNVLEEVQFLIVNAETGTRGFLLTRRREFLTPYERAKSLLPARRKELESLVASEPREEPRREKTARFKRIETLLDAQMKALGALQERSDASPQTLFPSLERSKSDMDDLRSQLRQMRGEEELLLQDRLSDITRVRRRDYLGVALTLVVGILARALWVYLFNTGISARLERARANLRARQNGEDLPHDATQTPDALGELERDILALADLPPQLEAPLNAPNQG